MRKIYVFQLRSRFRSRNFLCDEHGDLDDGKSWTYHFRRSLSRLNTQVLQFSAEICHVQAEVSSSYCVIHTSIVWISRSLRIVNLSRVPILSHTGTASRRKLSIFDVLKRPTLRALWIIKASVPIWGHFCGNTDLFSIWRYILSLFLLPLCPYDGLSLMSSHYPFLLFWWQLYLLSPLMSRRFICRSLRN